MIIKHIRLKTILGLFCFILVCTLCACRIQLTEQTTSAPEETILPSLTQSETIQPPLTSETLKPVKTPQPYPYEDGQGRMRYQLIVNGETVETDNLPYSISGEEGAYYPLEDVLKCFGVSCVVNKDSRSATGRVNGKVFKVQARDADIIVGESTINSEATPQYVDGCLYVPSFLFMELLDGTVDFTPDRSGATLVTDIIIDDSKSTTDGLELADNIFGDGSVQLTLPANGQPACAKLLSADALGKGEEILTIFIEPNNSADLYFSAGTYILKLAYGEAWISDDEAFGETGTYTSTEACMFQEGGKYRLVTSASEGDFYTDSQSGFTGN